MKLPPPARRRPRLNLDLLEARTVPASITVSTLSDIVDGDTSSIAALIATQGADNGISLREAILAANRDTAADVIDFSINGVIKLGGPSGTPPLPGLSISDGQAGPTAFFVDTPITIHGSGQVLQRDSEVGAFRFFTVTSDGEVREGDLVLENLELRNGRAQGGDGISGGGGAAGLGGAIFNNGATLTIRNSTFTQNVAIGGTGSIVNQQGSPGGGGGLGESATDGFGGGPNGGDFQVRNGGFGGGGVAGNESAAGNGGFGGGGGGSAFGGTPGNGGFGGGGGGTTSQVESGIGGFGGADAVETSGGGGAGLGGAIFSSGGTLNIVNSTFTANTAIGGSTPGTAFRGRGLGGAIFNLNGPAVVIFSSTVVANQADEGGSIYNLTFGGRQGIPSQDDANVLLENSIFEDSTSPDLLGNASLPAASGDEIHNTFVLPQQSGGAFIARIAARQQNPNKKSVLTNGDGLVNDGGDISDTGGLLTEAGRAVQSQLAYNTGPTRTLAITTESSAYDAGDAGYLNDPANNNSLESDQRGLFRNVGNAPDIGAFEVQKVTPPPPPVVSVEATDAEADENVPGDVLVLVFHRTGDLTNPLTITYTYATNGLSPADIASSVTTGGTATAQGNTVTLTFAAGSDAVITTTTPVNDIHAEADESATVTLLPGQGYDVDEEHLSATGTILQNDFVVINTNDSGEGSLRQAILNANALPGFDTITFAPDLAGATITLTSVDCECVGPSAFRVESAMRIDGTGQIITRADGPVNFRFFYITGEGGDLTLDDLEIRNGIAKGSDGTEGGGGAAGLGGAIFNEGHLVLRNTTFVGNYAIGGGVNGESSGSEGAFGGNGGFGGGGSVESGPGFGVEDAGPGAAEAGAGFGGAVFNYGGNAVIVNSTFFNNTATGGENPTGANTGNHQQGYGGGLFNLNGTVDITNSTFARNRADVGGSVYNLAMGADPGYSQRVYTLGDAEVQIHNSIFVDSLESQIPFDGPAAFSADELHNLTVSNEFQGESSRQVSGGNFIARIDAFRMVGEDQRLSTNITNNGGLVYETGADESEKGNLITATKPVVALLLENNGGPVRTLALTRDSEARDTGLNADAIDLADEGGALQTDERGAGFPRVFNETVDLGAFELQTPFSRKATLVIVSPTKVVIQDPDGTETPVVDDPFPDFGGESRVAVGDINNDGIVDFVFTAGNLGGSRVLVINGADGKPLFDFLAYAADFRGGVYVAVGDIDGDGWADIITGAGESGGPHVRAFSGRDGSMLANFFAFDSGHRSGVTVAVGDVTGDGILDIITGSGPGDGSEIRIFDGTKLEGSFPVPFGSLFPYGADYKDGVFIAVGNLDGDRFEDIVAGPLARGSTTTAVVFSGATLKPVKTFFDDEPSLFVGIRFTITDSNGDGIDDMVVVAGDGGGPREIVVNPLTGEQLSNSFFDDPNLRASFYIAGGVSEDRG